SICSVFHSKLAEPLSSQESNYLMNHAYQLGGQFWIGISDIAEEDRWIYSSSQQPITIRDFNSNNPNGQKNSNCVVLWHDYHGRWSDEPCHSTFYFICEAENETIGEVVG
ncbi:C-type lectin domain family 3 member A-like, partial [Saccostrea cucullata]|uniref:C-type lectin domain family 3 member A-like n=1 Tax=Saccostrea cuccullata TaxID=36930 RepID=UPI002ED55AFB